MTTNTPGMTVEQGNRLIAEFMDFDMEANEKWGAIEDGPGYHSSWDWLMPVVEKIESTKTIDKVRKNLVPTNVIISKSEGWEKDDRKQTCTIIQFTWDGHRVEKFHKEKITAVWLACIAFIQFYNTQTPTT